jgi:hypothetical protein
MQYLRSAYSLCVGMMPVVNTEWIHQHLVSSGYEYMICPRKPFSPTFQSSCDGQVAYTKNNGVSVSLWELFQLGFYFLSWLKQTALSCFTDP